MKIKSITPVGKKKVYDISVKDTEHYVLENGVVVHNSSILYSSNQVFVISKSQEKDGGELSGFNFTINIEKSRFVREKSKFPFTVTFDSGINKYSGLLDIALELGFCQKPNSGWYSRVDMESGELEEKKFRLKDTNNKEFWEPILNSDKFKQAVFSRYCVSSSNISRDDYNTLVEDTDIEDIEDTDIEDIEE
jgi:hypothetical protein